MVMSILSSRLILSGGTINYIPRIALPNAKQVGRGECFFVFLVGLGALGPCDEEYGDVDIPWRQFLSVVRIITKGAAGRFLSKRQP